MNEALEDRLRELARRAGVSEAPAPVVLAVVCLAALAIAWAGWRWWPRSGSTGEPGVADAFVEHAAIEPARPSAPTTTEATATLLVHVVGSVRRPGVYELNEGDRVVDAIDAAGGVLPDAVLEGLNMARKIGDGEQVLVPDEDNVAPAAGPPGAAPSTAGGSAPIDINAADASALQDLPGVGPATAEKIVADREANGPFKSVDDLQRVSGIGPKKLEQFEGLACVR